MLFHSLSITLILEVLVLGCGIYLGRSERKLQRGIGVALQILSVLGIVAALIAWGMSD